MSLWLSGVCNACSGDLGICIGRDKGALVIFSGWTNLQRNIWIVHSTLLLATVNNGRGFWSWLICLQLQFFSVTVCTRWFIAYGELTGPIHSTHSGLPIMQSLDLLKCMSLESSGRAHGALSSHSQTKYIHRDPATLFVLPSYVACAQNLTVIVCRESTPSLWNAPSTT